MIYLRKGQVVADIPNMVVYEATGFYNDGDSVICAPATTPEEPVCRYEARYIAYGGMVYSISDPDQLLEEIIKIDPNSLYGKTSKQVAVDKAVDTIVPQDQAPQDKVASSTPNITNAIASSTPALAGSDAFSSTTPNVTPDIVPDVSTTTPATPSGITPDIIPDVSTTTPNVTPDIVPDVSTTTPATPSGITPDIIPDVSTTTAATPSGVTPDIVPDVSTTTPTMPSGTTPDIIPDVSTTPNVTPDIVPDVVPDVDVVEQITQ